MKAKAKRQFTTSLLLALVLVLFGSQTIYAQTETDLKQWTEAYIKAISSPDWAEKMIAFGWTTDFIPEHKIFRDAYTDYKPNIKFIFVEGNEVMVWLVITAKHVAQFPHDELKDSEPKGQLIIWNEVWYFDVIDGKLGDKWEMLVNGIDKMKSAGVKCLPD